MAGKRRGVLQPLVVKSIRISREESLLKGSRQNGQAGEERGEVFSTMVKQQLAHRTCPMEKKIMMRKKKGKKTENNEKLSYRKESSVGDDVAHTPPRRRRRSSREQV
jgi:hypothetical protein